MTHRSNNLLDRLNVNMFQRMNNLSHRLCVAPMMDRTDSFYISIGCEAVCAQRVHEETTIVFARVRRNAILASQGGSAGAQHHEFQFLIAGGEGSERFR
jgi:hypothetical protein